LYDFSFEGSTVGVDAVEFLLELDGRVGLGREDRFGGGFGEFFPFKFDGRGVEKEAEVVAVLTFALEYGDRGERTEGCCFEICFC
jgi:hypothetical protein